MAASGEVELVNNLVLYSVATGTYPSGDEAVREHGDGYTGGPNLYYGNVGGDAENPFPDDVFGVDPGLPSSLDCDTVRLEDVALLDRSVAIGSGSALGVFDDFGAVELGVDGDGYGEPEDCADDDPAVSPGEVEVPCNGVDDDCDPGTTDDDGCGTGDTDTDVDTDVDTDTDTNAATGDEVSDAASEKEGLSSACGCASSPGGRGWSWLGRRR